MFGTLNKSLQFFPPLLFVLLTSACGPKKQEQTVVFWMARSKSQRQFEDGL